MTGPPRSTRHVLVADDEPHIGRIIKMKLEQGPFRVTLAYDGREALDALERDSRYRSRPARPDDAASERARRARAHARRRAARRDLPCIILTAAGQEQQHQRAHGARRERVPHEAVQPEEAVRARRGAGRAWRRRSRAPDDRMSRWAVVLAGGVGSRFWPLSTPRASQAAAPARRRRAAARRDAFDRLAPLVAVARTLILTNAVLVDADRASCSPSMPRENIIAEPRAGRHGGGAGVGRAGDRAARWTRRGDDLRARRLGDRRRRRLPRDARAAAPTSRRAHRALVTVGVVPSRPDPGLRLHPAGASVDRRRAPRGALRREARSRDAPQQMVQRGLPLELGDLRLARRRLPRRGAARSRPRSRRRSHAHADDIGAFFARRARRSRSTSACSSAASACWCCPATSAGTTSARGPRCAACARATRTATPRAGACHCARRARQRRARRGQHGRALRRVTISSSSRATGSRS